MSYLEGLLSTDEPLDDFDAGQLLEWLVVLLGDCWVYGATAEDCWRMKRIRERLWALERQRA